MPPPPIIPLSVVVEVEVALRGKKRTSCASKSLLSSCSAAICEAKVWELEDCSPVREFSWVIIVFTWDFNAELFWYKSQDKPPKPIIRSTMNIVTTAEPQDFLGATAIGAMLERGAATIGLGFMPGTAGPGFAALGWKIFSIGFWAVKETMAGEAENGRATGDGEDIGAKASRFIFLGSVGAATFGAEGMAGAAGEGFAMGWVVCGVKAGAIGEGDIGFAATIGGTAATGELSLKASTMSDSAQPTERRLFLMDDSLSPEPSCCLM